MPESQERIDSPLTKLNRALGRNVLYITRSIIRHLPYGVYRVFFHLFNVLGRPVIIKKRKLAIANLKLAFGDELDDKQIKELADKCFTYFGRGMIDLIYLADRPELIKEKVSIVGKEHLDKVFAEGKGAIVVSAHFGYFILMYMRMALEGYETNIIMKRVRDEQFEEYISEFRNENGLKTIYDLPARQCVQKCIKALRNNELLFILLDQNYGSDGRVFVDFFGTPAATAAGPVVFSNRTKAPVLPIFIMRDDDGGHKIVIEPPIPLEEGSDDQEVLVRNVTTISKKLESYIRKNPHEWGGWMHKRWKSRPLDEQSEIDRLKEEGKFKESEVEILKNK